MPLKKTRHERILGTLISFMLERNKWKEKMNDEIPRYFEKYGDHLLFPESAFTDRNWSDAGEDIWKLVCKLYNGKAIAVGGSIRNDSYRTPNAHLIYGDTTFVNFIDNHVKYTWDIEKNMFSSGNVNERHRIGRLNCEGEVIVDLFAGIGYFTLPYLVHAKAKFVHACEWNVNAIEALRRNLELNAVANRCHIYEGDNRQVSPRKVADRVNLGIIPSSEDYWSVACEALLEKGGILYVHQNVTSKFNSKTLCEVCESVKFKFNLDNNEKCQLLLECYVENKTHRWSQVQDCSLSCKKKEWFHFAVHIIHSISSILNNIHSTDWKVCVRDIFKVKSYAPHVDHIVYTVHCLPL